MIDPLKTIAFADDEPSILHALQRTCEARYQIVGKAQNGLEAVTLVQTLIPQVIMLDLHMPVMDGLEALKRILVFHTTAVVMLTADQDEKVARHILDLGACGYMTKPFESSQIIPMLETAWYRFRTAQGLEKEVVTLKESLETRILLDRAKAILMDQQGFTESQAHKTLQKMSQDQAISLQDVCRSLIQVKNLLGKSAQRKAV